MADLVADGQFELDGIPFGVDLPVFVTPDGFQPGRAELLTSRAKIGSGDGVRMGQDRFGSATWSFRLATNAEDAEGALDAYAELGEIWPRDDVRLTSGRVSTLRYRFGGRVRVVYGRGGRWTPTIDNALWSGMMSAAADFETVDHLYYDDEIESTTIPIAPIEEPGGGVIPPFITPFVSTGTNPARQGEVVVGGRRPTPVWLVIDGPVSNPKVVSSTGWVAEILDTVYENDPVTVDGRPWARSATRQSGGAVQVSPRVTQISKLILPPGSHTLTFTGTDPTGTASVAVNWRKAYPTL